MSKKIHVARWALRLQKYPKTKDGSSWVQHYIRPLARQHDLTPQETAFAVQWAYYRLRPPRGEHPKAVAELVRALMMTEFLPERDQEKTIREILAMYVAVRTGYED